MNTPHTLTIALDLDDTLSDNMEQLVALYNKESGDTTTLESFTSWGLSDAVLPEWKDKIGDIFLRPEWFQHLHPRKDMQKAVSVLSKSFNLVVVTAYHPQCCYDKAVFIQTHFPEIDKHSVIFCNKKQLINAHFLVDDGGHNLVDYPKTPICMDKPWNRNVHMTNDGRPIQRIYNGDDLLSLMFSPQLYIAGTSRGKSI